MINFINTLNSKIVIDNIIVNKMKYDIGMLFIDTSSNSRAHILAKQINSQLDTALYGIDGEDLVNIKRALILNSFLVLPNPISNRISYGNVFTSLTNYDDDFIHTKIRLTDWLDKNTDIEYDEVSLTQYIKSYKLKSTTEQRIKVAALQYHPGRKKTETINTDITEITTKNKYTINHFKIASIPLVILLLIFSIDFMDTNKNLKLNLNHVTIETNHINEIKFFSNYTKKNIPLEFQYKEINYLAFIEFLDKEKKSLLIEDNYIDIIDSLSKQNNINPILLFAIIGQEQGFVNKNNNQASKIINNPYNVYNSWKKYNTDLEDSTTICINTILTASKNRPQNEDFLEWLNKTYAEDENWSIGVKKLYIQLQSFILK